MRYSAEYRRDVEATVDALIEEAGWDWYRISVYYYWDGKPSSSHHSVKAPNLPWAIRIFAKQLLGTRIADLP